MRVIAVEEWLNSRESFIKDASHEYIYHFVKTVEFYYDRSWIKDMNFDPHILTYGNPKGQPALRSNWAFDGHTLTTPVPNNHDLRVACKEKGLYTTRGLNKRIGSGTWPLD